ncbi:unnamed protein product [Ceutorhynchus assimilis]|uniref:C2H2-type domain-containing protein n=1 Tax=Ceutorhynchus assimilis TaxID=467358 RepID=A0A9N9QMF2_9CUCU|nr:unnamed protein product [Ceutorhynchus assimilis]
MESTSEEKEMLVLNDPHAVQNDILNPRSNYKWAVNNKVPKNGRKNKVKETEFIVTETGEFQCLQCEFDVTKGLQRRHKMVQHILSEHRDVKKLHQCPHCPFKSPYGLNSHILSKHTSEKDIHWIKCDKCDYKCKKKHQLNKHSIVHYNDGDLPLIELLEKNKVVCEICGYTSHSATKLRLHQITHQKKIDEKELKYRCHKCDYKTYRLYSFKIHKLNHLKPSQIKYFYCYHCDFKGKRKDNLKTHILRHFKKEEVTLKCYLCEFSTKKRQSLTDHLSMKHTNKNQ